MLFEHPSRGLLTFRNFAAFHTRSTQCAQKDCWTVQTGTESILPLKSSIYTNDPP